eukprot:548042_1
MTHQLDDGDDEKSIFKAFVGIDFGTDGSGLAYGLPDGSAYIHNMWDDTEATRKPKTSVLFDSSNSVLKVGSEAQNLYLKCTGDQGWKLFERFKMSLYEEPKSKSDLRKAETKMEYVELKEKIISTNNTSIVEDSSKVFIEELKHLKKEAMKYLKKMKKIKKLKFKPSDIQWILTVPAIWDETAKHQMRHWAKKAGLINNHSQCIIVLEPDCASLAVQHYILNKQTENIENKYSFNLGDKYILVDVGGGTADIACHEILTENDMYGVKEIYHPSGGAFGASYIDDEFIHMLEKIFSKQWIDEFKIEYANIYVELIHKFRVAKESYYIQEEKTNNHNWHYIELPEEFVYFLDEKCESVDEENDIEAEHMFENAQINGMCSILTLIRPQSMDDSMYYLAVHEIVWKYLFDIIVIKIIDDCRGILSHAMMKECKYMILVGGLACNKYYRQRMTETFGDSVSIIVPPNPILAVVEGAALFAFQPDYIKARVLSMTYGISCSYSLEACESVNINKEFIEKNKFERSKGEWWVDNLFYPLAFKNQSVYLGKAIYYSFMRRNKINKVNLHLYCSESDTTPLTIDDENIQEFGCINTEMSIEFKNEKNMCMIVKLIFHDSLLRIFAYPKTDWGESYRERELELEYEHY